MVQHVEMSEVPVVQDGLLRELKALLVPKSKSAVAQSEPQPQPEFKRQIVWFNALGFLVLHLGGVYAIHVAATQAKLLTIFWTTFMGIAGSQGVQMGAHRLYSHKAFKASPALKFALVLLQTLAGQNCMYIWVRDHRQHHKWSDTDGDPHNARRGFFFSHIGWLMCRKHPEVIAKGKSIDLSDLEADPFVMFQKKYYKTLYILFSIGLPMMVPYWLWGEDLLVSFLVAYLARTIVTLNLTWLINSAAHKFGNRPYTKDLVPVECSVIAVISMGENWHNYHHTFPWDYKAAELGGAKHNLTAWLIDRCADCGLAWDLRSATQEMIQHRILNRGDGTHSTVTSSEHPSFTEKVKEDCSESTRLRRLGT